MADPEIESKIVKIPGLVTSLFQSVSRIGREKHLGHSKDRKVTFSDVNEVMTDRSYEIFSVSSVDRRDTRSNLSDQESPTNRNADNVSDYDHEDWGMS